MTTNFLKSKLEKINAKYTEKDNEILFNLNGFLYSAVIKDNNVNFFFAQDPHYDVIFDDFEQVLLDVKIGQIEKNLYSK